VLAQGSDIETLRLLKVHGSINWYYSGSDSPHGETVYEGGLTYGWDAEYVHVAGDRGLDLLVDKVPFVVPPTGTMLRITEIPHRRQERSPPFSTTRPSEHNGQ
jgi:hypothetical protein